MINVNDLREFRQPVMYNNGYEITLFSVQKAIWDCASGMGIPIAFVRDSVKSGGLLSSSAEECLVMYHPQHVNDYFKFCIRLKRQGTVAVIYINDFGVSKQMKKANTAEFMKQDRQGMQMSYKIGSMIGQGLRTIGSSRAKLEEEEIYYRCISDIFDQIVS